MILERWAREELLQKLKTSRVVSVGGCRQSGKTTLLLNAPLANPDFRSLGSALVFEEARSDPVFFVRRHKADVMVIDEVQRVPQLVGEIQFAVDRDPGKGQYVVSSSSDCRKLPQAHESLDGRTGFVRVRTFSEAEKRQKKPGFLKALFDGKRPLSLSLECSKPQVLSLAIQGGFPAVQDLEDPDARTRWFADYLAGKVSFDLQNQWGLRKKNVIKKVLKSAAVYSSRELTKSALASDFKVAWATLDTYFAAIEALYLVDSVSGWAETDCDRPGHAPKPFMTDSGLMAHLLKIFRPEDLLENCERLQNEGGKLVETWVYNQLAAEADLHPAWSIQYFRSRHHEIDFLVTDEAGRLLGIEVKVSESVASEDFRQLRWMQKLVGPENFSGVVLYAGDRVRSEGNGFYALPMSAMWSDFEE